MLIVASLVSISPKLKDIVIKEKGTKLPIIVYHDIDNATKN